jgi:hypothetical protein
MTCRTRRWPGVDSASRKTSAQSRTSISAPRQDLDEPLHQCTRCAVRDRSRGPELRRHRSRRTWRSRPICPRRDLELQGNVVDLCPVGALTAKPPTVRRAALGTCEDGVVRCQDAVGSAIRSTPAAAR